MGACSPWPWTESLGGVPPDGKGTYAVRRILFGLVQDRCRELGITEGETLRCRGRSHEGVVVELASGARRSVGLEHAWFVQVQPVGEETPAR